MTFPKKNFYYVRHGETKRSLDIYSFDPNHQLTQNGIKQAKAIRSVIEKLPIDFIVTSTLSRSIDTAKIIAPKLFYTRLELEGLCECCRKVWLQLEQLGEHIEYIKDYPEALEYFERVAASINSALTKKGTPLFIAHGGTHWVISHLLSLTGYNRKIGYCVPICFSPAKKGGWTAEYINN